jgi:hypothetical protein
MNKLDVALVVSMALGAAGSAAAAERFFPTPEFFASARGYLDANGFRDGCVTVRVRGRENAESRGATEILVHRSSGDGAFDALVVTDLRREIEDLERFPLDRYPADAAGWRTLPLKLSSERHREVLGCAGTQG